MQKSTPYIIIAILLTLIIGLGIVSSIEVKPQIVIPQQKLGSAVNDGAYKYISLNSSNATSTVGVFICGGSCTLGRIVVGSTTVASVVVYDGNTTATSSGTKVARLGPSAAVGTYNYEVQTNKGIVLDLTGYAGDMTISYK